MEEKILMSSRSAIDIDDMSVRIKEPSNKGELMLVKCAMSTCDREYNLSITKEVADAWKASDEAIQDFLSDYPAWEREMLLSGCCPVCWKGFFGEEDDNIDD